MKKEKRMLLVLVVVLTALNINSRGDASPPGRQNNSLQWFPSLAADSGAVYIVWADERNGNYTRMMNGLPHKSGDIYIAKGTFRNGWVFDKNIRVNDIKGTTGHGSPSIAVDNDNLYLVWEDDRFGFEELYFSTSPKNNIRFQKDFPVVAEAGSQVLPSIALVNGTAYVAMMDKKNWDIDFTEGTSVNGIYRFDRPMRVNDDTSGNWHYAPSLAVDNEKNVCIAWLDARNSNYDIYFSHGTKENEIWRFGRNTRVNDDSANVSHYTPSLAFENGTAYIAWYDNRNKDFDIYFSAGRLINNNWEFGENIRVNDEPGGDQMHPRIAVRGGEISAVWEDGRTGGPDIYFSKGAIKNGSPKFSKNIQVNSIKGKHYDPQLGVAGGNVYVAWQAEVNDSGDIYLSQGKYDGENWEFSRSIKVNDDLTDSFTKPDPLFLGLVFGSVLISVILVRILRTHGQRKT